MRADACLARPRADFDFSGETGDNPKPGRAAAGARQAIAIYSCRKIPKRAILAQPIPPGTWEMSDRRIFSMPHKGKQLMTLLHGSTAGRSQAPAATFM